MYIIVYIEVLFFLICLCMHLQAIPSMVGNGWKWTFGADWVMIRDLDDVATSLSRHFVESSFD